MGGTGEIGIVHVCGTAFGILQRGALHGEAHPELAQHENPPLPRDIVSDFVPGGTVSREAVRPRLVAKCVQPGGPDPSTSRRAASRGVKRLLASLQSVATSGRDRCVFWTSIPVTRPWHASYLGKVR